MDYSQPYVMLLAVGIVLMSAQLLVKNKSSSHILFAGFCGSMSMMAAQGLTQESLGSYHHLLGIGACFTCNGYWLLSRTLFRQQEPIAPRHLLLAAVVGLLICASMGLQTINEFKLWGADTIIAPVQIMFGELLTLLSSGMLLLTFWEAYRGFSGQSIDERRLRLLFLGTYFGALISGLLMASMFAALSELFVTIAVLMTMVVTQYLIWYRTRSGQSNYRSRPAEKGQSIGRTQNKVLTENSTPSTQVKSTSESDCSGQDHELIQALRQLLYTQNIYLTANLKVADLARELNTSEYRVSQILRSHFNAGNFNQFINQLRIEHAKSLLADKSTTKWPVLVIGLESGFASIGPFNRAFKAVTGDTPNSYRKRQQQ